MNTRGSRGALTFAALLAVFLGGFAVGLLALVYSSGRLLLMVSPAAPPSRQIALMIATGLGLHNLSEGLAIGQGIASGGVALTGILVIGFGLHNITEGFGIGAPLATDERPPSWQFLGLAGLIGGGPTALGAGIGSLMTSPFLYVLLLTLAAGAIVYVINEMFPLGKRISARPAMAWGLLLGFTGAYLTDLLLTYAGA